MSDWNFAASSLSALSRRGRQILDAPPMPAYIYAHRDRVAELWDATERPDGYVPLCIAENKHKAEDLLALLARYKDAPIGALGYDAMLGNLQFREHLAAFMKREFAKVRATRRACVIQYAAKIQSGARDAGNRFAVNGIGQNVAAAITVDPLIQHQVSELFLHTDLKKI